MIDLRARVWYTIRIMSIRPKKPPEPEPLKHSTTVRTYVVAPNTDYFMQYVKVVKKNLQDCKPVTSVEGCRGLGFTSPLDELVVLSGWEQGKDIGWIDAVHHLISRYCQDKRVHDVPRYTT